MKTIEIKNPPKRIEFHWHPLINAAIKMGGIIPEQDSQTGRLADEYRLLSDMPCLLNKSGLPLDEMARTITEEFPETISHIDTDVFDGNIYPEDLRDALERALRAKRPEREKPMTTKTKTKRGKRTDSQKKEWREKMNALVKQVGAMSKEEREAIAKRAPIVTSDGHPISGFNTCFLMHQTELPLTVIGGFKQWQRAGRTVIPGESAAGYIYVPMNGKKQDDESKERERMYFKLAPMFDISQTEEK